MNLHLLEYGWTCAIFANRLEQQGQSLIYIVKYFLYTLDNVYAFPCFFFHAAIQALASATFGSTPGAAAAGAAAEEASPPSALLPPATAIPATATRTTPPKTIAFLLSAVSNTHESIDDTFIHEAYNEPPELSDGAATTGAVATGAAAGAGAAAGFGASNPLRVGASAGAVLPPMEGRGVSLTVFFAGTATGAFFFSTLMGSTAGLDVKDGKTPSFPVLDLIEDKSCSSYDVFLVAAAMALSDGTCNT